MKKLFLIIAPLALLLSGCNKEESEYDKYWISYGTVVELPSAVPENSLYTVILRDDGARLVVTSNMIPQLTLEMGDRLIINYNILEDLYPTYGGPARLGIRLNAAQKILCKGTVAESFIRLDEQHRNDSIGTDPVQVAYAWFGGDFLNVRFGMMRQDPSIVHYITLVHDDTNPDGQSVYLSLRHNANGDAGARMAFGYVSFDIRGLLPAGASGMHVKLDWTDYDGQHYQDEGTYSVTSSLTLTGTESDQFFDSTPVK